MNHHHQAAYLASELTDRLRSASQKYGEFKIFATKSERAATSGAQGQPSGPSSAWRVSLVRMQLATAIARLERHSTELLRKPQVIMFDLDGTLIDTMFAFAELAAEVMQRNYGDDMQQARADYLATSGIPFRQQLELIHPDHERNPKASAEFEHLKRKVCDSTPLEARTSVALHELRRRGIKLVLSSNGAQHFVDEFVAREQFPFDLALGFDASQALAKGEAHVRRTTTALDVGRQDILFVGDSLKDGEFAASTGVRFVGCLGTFGANEFAAHFDRINTVRHICELTALF